MPHTETFYVSTSDNKIRPINGNIASYFNPNCKGENLGKAKYIIEVFSYNHHKETAKKIRNIIDENGLSDKLFHVTVATK